MTILCRPHLHNELIKLKNELLTLISSLQPEFDWTADTIGVVDSSYFWGYIITQIPGGFLAARLPANRVFGTAIAISAALNILLPGSAYIHPGAFVIIRIFQGFAEVSFSILSVEDRLVVRDRSSTIVENGTEWDPADRS